MPTGASFSASDAPRASAPQPMKAAGPSIAMPGACVKPGLPVQEGRASLVSGEADGTVGAIPTSELTARSYLRAYHGPPASPAPAESGGLHRLRGERLRPRTKRVLTVSSGAGPAENVPIDRLRADPEGPGRGRDGGPGGGEHVASEHDLLLVER